MAILDYEYDSKSISPEIKRGIDFLYEAADRRGAVAAWADCFTTDAKLHKGKFSPVGIPALVKYLEASWDNTNSRVHDVKKLTVLQTSPLTISVEGKTTYQRSNGEEQKGVWTAVQTYAEENGVQKIMDYKINFNMLY